ncbi:adenine nucleotide transporter [Dioszegia hungarica]|uniref:Adenine nucleotide transporter n=1 Tax=Dioszegia hungarica TaxID=4972 RepID=A0AA38H880_9TREE|nr:adenine nucleotide transporter [Dioszegia hungarica]KAI9636257.1 adenine nucleotide transporter [Dioszegia hungarica]
MTVRPPLTPFGSALAGALGAVFSNAAVYPLDTVKTRLQALPASAIEAPVVSSEAARSQKRNGNILLRLPNALLRRLRKWQMLTMLIRILRTEGLTGAFKGFTANMLNTFSMQFAYFFFHTYLRTAYITRQTRLARPTSLSTPAELGLGAAAGALAQIFTIPVAVIATRQQLWVPAVGSAKNVKEPNFIETAREVIAEGGVSALWTGLRPGLVLTVNPAITYGVFERLKTWRLAEKGVGAKLGVAEAFWCGVLSKTLATVVTYPYIFAKVRLQARPTPKPIAGQTSGTDDASYAAIASAEPAEGSAVVGPEGEPHEKVVHRPIHPAHATVDQRGAISLLTSVYREKGLAGWYQGLGAQITKAVLCQGILFVSKDQFEGHAALILEFLSRLRSRV